MKKILLIDDDKLFHQSFNATFASTALNCFFAENSKKAIELLDKESFHLIFLDLDLGKENGLDVIELIREYERPICILSGTATIQTSIEAMKKGAVDLIEKPLRKDQILKLIEKHSIKTSHEISPIRWKSKKMILCETELQYLAKSPAKILLRGETGVGKEVLARKIHHLAFPENDRFVAVNCAAIPRELIEHELFGSVKGAFTGADKDHDGLICEAENGTLFLDEIAELPLDMQSKLLRFLQEGEIRPLGSNKTKIVTTRVIAATHVDLEQAVKEKLFREDLYFRLNVVMIDIPPLRDRREDLELLIEDLVEKFKIIYHNEPKFSIDVIEQLKEYPWPGNVRELSNLIERLCLTTKGLVELEQLPEKYRINMSSSKVLQNPNTLKEARENFEKEFIEQCMSESSNLKELSERLGLERTTLYKKMRSLGLNWKTDKNN
jgi:two-component system, NtrC family, nitrogen regulation response regulator NtrX